MDTIKTAASAAVFCCAFSGQCFYTIWVGPGEGPRQRERIAVLRRSSHLRSGKHASRAKGIPISSSRAKSRDLYSRTINDENEKAEKRSNKTSVFFGALLRMTAVQWRFLDCARNDDTGKPLSKHAGIFVIGISLLAAWSPHPTFPSPRIGCICYNKSNKSSHTATNKQ